MEATANPDVTPAGADRWEPERKGSDQMRELEGKLVRYRNYTTEYGDLLVMFIETDDGRTWSRKITGAALTRAVAREKPLPGERISLHYRGWTKVQSGPYAGTDCHDWRVTMPGRAPAVPDFASLAEGEVRMRAPSPGPASEPDAPVNSAGLPEPGDDDVPF
jgi:hypothetical protein